MFENEWFPYAYQMGISWDEFWKLNPRIISLMLKGYKERKEAELQEQNVIAHLQGQYMVEAILSTVGNMFSKKTAKPHRYPKNPYEFGEEKPLTEEELQKQREQFVAQFEAMRVNFELQKGK